MKKRIVKLYENDVIRYIFWGGCTTLVNLVSFYIMRELGIILMAANVVSIILAILFAYVVNSRFVFHDQCATLADHIRPFLKFVSARLVTMVIEVGGVWLLAVVLGFHDMVAKFCEWLQLDGVLITEEGYGNPDTDLIMNCKKIEAEGVKTVIITDEYAGRDGKSQSLADADPAADAVVTGGNANQVIVLPKMDKVIGTEEFVTTIAGGNEHSHREDGTIEVEIQAITGATNETGFGYLSAR